MASINGPVDKVEISTDYDGDYDSATWDDMGLIIMPESQNDIADTEEFRTMQGSTVTTQDNENMAYACYDLESAGVLAAEAADTMNDPSARVWMAFTYNNDVHVMGGNEGGTVHVSPRLSPGDGQQAYKMVRVSASSGVQGGNWDVFDITPA